MAGWIGHPLDPITTLVHCLLEASLSEEDLQKFQNHHDWLGVVASEESNPPASNGTPNPLKFRHNSVSDNRYCDRKSNENESYLTMAVEAALIGLGQHRTMTQGKYSQEKSLKQEEKLLMRLYEIEMDDRIVTIVKQQAQIQLEGGPFSGFGEGILTDAVPLHNFAKFLFRCVLK